MAPELYNALARLTPQVAIESVLMREQDGEIQIYLTQRSATDTAYPSEWHSPGSILRAGEDYDAVLGRLAKREFHTSIIGYDVVDEIFFQEERGWFNNRILLIKVDGEPTGGKWVNVYALPADTVDHHVSHVIPKALTAFLKRQR